MGKEIIITKDLIDVDLFVNGIKDPSLREASRLMALAYRRWQDGTDNNMDAGINLSFTGSMSKNAIANRNFINEENFIENKVLKMKKMK